MQTVSHKSKHSVPSPLEETPASQSNFEKSCEPIQTNMDVLTQIGLQRLRLYTG